MDGISIATNIKDFSAQIQSLSSRVARRVVGRAVAASGIVFRNTARQLAPVLKVPDKRRVAGTLKKNIIFTRRRSKDPLSINGRVTVKTTRRRTAVQLLKLKRRGVELDPFWWVFLEAGYIPRARKSGGLRGGVRSKALQRKRALQSGAKKISFPFLDPAFKKSRSRALEAFSAQMDQGLREEAARVG